jgi:hypothetical protein
VIWITGVDLNGVKSRIKNYLSVIAQLLTIDMVERRMRQLLAEGVIKENEHAHNADNSENNIKNDTAPLVHAGAGIMEP